MRDFSLPLRSALFWHFTLRKLVVFPTFRNNLSVPSSPKILWTLRYAVIPYILESNPHSVFGDFSNGKKFAILLRTFSSTAPCPQSEWLNNIGCYRCVKTRRYAWGRWVTPVPWSGSFSTSVRNLVWARITIQLWAMTANLMIINKINYCIVLFLRHVQRLHHIVLTARTATPYFQNPALDRESNPRAMVIRIWYFKSSRTVKRVRIRFENIRYMKWCGWWLSENLMLHKMLDERNLQYLYCDMQISSIKQFINSWL
jgi:hypothetical protein